MLAQRLQEMKQWHKFSIEEKQFLLKRSGYLMAAGDASAIDCGGDGRALEPFLSGICRYLIDVEPYFQGGILCG